MQKKITAGDFTAKLDCPLTYGDVDLDVIYNDIFVEPADATLDPENDYSVTDSVVGVSFDKEAGHRKNWTLQQMARKSV